MKTCNPFSSFLSTAWKCVSEKRHCDTSDLFVRTAAFALTITSTPLTVYEKNCNFVVHNDAYTPR